MIDSPWLHIPAPDYEAHMRAVGQSAALRELFARVYTALGPARVAILGCSTGGDFETLDAAITSAAVGVDLNSEYLAIAEQRLTAAGSSARLIHGDVLQADLSEGSFDLIHAGLLLEYVDPTALLARVAGWLSVEGTFSIVSQQPSEDLPAVSDAGYASLRALEGHMILRPATEVVALAEQAGFRLMAQHHVELASGKTLVGLCFRKGSV